MAVTCPLTWPWDCSSWAVAGEKLAERICQELPTSLSPSRYTLSTSNVGVVSLLCALFPCFPHTSQDNRYHLQALRHLYVLAARPGVLVTRDVATGNPCCVGVQITTGGVVTEATTPCLIQDWDRLEQVCTGHVTVV